MTSVWPPETWQDAERSHHADVDELVKDRLARLDRGQRHATDDFLWEYFSYRPGQLRRWHPGAGIVVTGPIEDFIGRRFYREVACPDGTPGATVDLAAFLERRGDTVDYVIDLLTRTASRPPQLACFCLHEWAMVYALPEGEARHPLPLRLGQAGTDEVVESHQLRCTHFDAYRFFTPQARPLLSITPTRENQRELEQPGCLHAIMDLYKWSYKLSPAIGSDIVLDAFRLARRVRHLDMASSPYDARADGLEPVPIETPDGKAEFVARQRALVAEAAVLRTRIVAALRGLSRSPDPTAEAVIGR